MPIPEGVFLVYGRYFLKSAAKNARMIIQRTNASVESRLGPLEAFDFRTRMKDRGGFGPRQT